MSGARPGGRRIHQLPPAEDVDRELRFHIESRVADLVAAGWDEGSARAEAERVFGDVGSIRRACREIVVRQRRAARGALMWSEVRQDLGYALRALRRSPGFALLAILTLALGIGANSAAFSVLNGVLLKPLPFPDSRELVRAYEARDDQQIAVSFPNFSDWRARARSFSALAAHNTSTNTTVLGGSEPVRITTTRVTRDFFDVMGVHPVTGRSFDEQEELVQGGRPAVIVGDAFWRQQLGARRDLTDVSVQVYGATAAVVGVMPPGFDYPSGTQLWFPVELFDPATLGDRTAHNASVTGRLANGVTVEAARTELNTIAAEIHEQFPDSEPGATVVSLQEQMVGDTRRALYILFAASGFVLLVASVNLASALLARAVNRQRELAVRAAMGAHRLRLIRQLLTESLTLSALGALAGLILAYATLRGFTAFGAGAVPRLDEISLDGWVLAFTILIAVATALTFGTAPAMRATSVEPHEALQESGRGTASRRQRRLWSFLVAGEVAIALLLLVGSGLLIRSFGRIAAVDPGFDPDGALAVNIALPSLKYADLEPRAAYYDDLLTRVRAIPGVESAGMTTSLPLVDFSPNGLFDIEGGELGEGDAHYRAVSAGYFEAMRMPIIEGRGIEESDRAGGLEVVVINETMARMFFPNGDAVGRRIRTGGMDARGFDFVTIVGIVGDVRFHSLTGGPVPTYYLSHRQRPNRISTAMLVVRTASNPGPVAGPLRQAIRAVDADVPIDIATLSERTGASVADRRFVMLVLAAFAFVALSLSAVGIYGVVASAVANRTREIGLRIALGAASGKILWTVSRDTLAGVAIGLTVGLVAAGFLARLATSLLFEVEPVDPITFASVALLLFGVAWLAVLVPAARAIGVDPMISLRAE